MMQGRCSLTGPGAAMSAPLHAALTPDQRQALLLSAGGMKVPQLAAHLDCCEATVRTLLHRFTEQGLAAEEDIHLKPRTVRLYLKRMGATWRRTHPSVRHRQDPELATAAGATLAGLKKSAGTGSWTSSSSTKPASAPPCRPPTPGAERACVPLSPTRIRRADA